MIPRYGDMPRPDQRFVHRPGAYAILPRGGQILLTFQETPEAEFQLPGGGIDAGESPLAALHREVFEETGWAIATPRKLGTFRRFGYMPDYDIMAEKLCHIYIARPVLRHGPPLEEGHTAIWAAPETALGLLNGLGNADALAAAMGIR